jgi:SET and MYND domain-containing protein
MFDGRSVALRALEPVSKGEQLFISYITATEDRLSRQTALKQRYFFDCQCEKCSKDESPYSTFLRYVPKAEGRIDVFCNSKHLINEASGLIKVTGGLISDLTRANKYLQQSQALAEQRAAKEQVLKKGANSCSTKHKQFALHPFPKIMHELYLNYLDISSFLNALIVLLFLFLNCDVYNYPQIHHPVRVIRLFTIAKLLKHISSLSPESIQSLTGDIKEHVITIKDIDWIDSFHTIMILVWEQGSKSHGKESRFVKGVETELREVEEVQRLRVEVGGRLRKWMSDADIPEGKKEAKRILEALKNLSEFAWEILRPNSEE